MPTGKPVGLLGPPPRSPAAVFPTTSNICSRGGLGGDRPAYLLRPGSKAKRFLDEFPLGRSHVTWAWQTRVARGGEAAIPQ